MVEIGIDYLAAGANRHPAAADWDAVSGLLAFGADRNIAIWNPLVIRFPTRMLASLHAD